MTEYIEWTGGNLSVTELMTFFENIDFNEYFTINGGEVIPAPPLFIHLPIVTDIETLEMLWAFRYNDGILNESMKWIPLVFHLEGGTYDVQKQVQVWQIVGTNC